MGRATKWLKGLFGIKKKKVQKEDSNSGDLKDKKRSSFGQSGRASGGFCNSPTTIPPNITAAEAAWLRSFYNETTEEQNKQAIAVAAATAAAADAAVAAARAAVAVVRLTSRGRDTMFSGGRENWAAVKIQTLFRAHLARKALKALKGLVKLQALVRGYLVRNQATATLHSMQALIRAQASIRAQRTRRSINNDDSIHSHHRTQKSIGRIDDTGSEHTVSAHSTRLSASFGTTTNTNEGSPKIVEVDTGRPKSKFWRTNTSVSDSGDESCGQTLSSPFRCRVPAHLRIPDGRNFQDADWDLTGDECLFSTAQSTPRFVISDRSNAPVTPAKSVCVDSYFRQYTNFPSYMASTQSFAAKLRSMSAPKQRPEPGLRKRLSLNEMMESRNSLSGIRMQRSCTKVQEVINFKNVVMSKLDRSSDLEKQKETIVFKRKC